MVTPFCAGVQLSLYEMVAQIPLQAYSTEVQVCVVRRHSQQFSEIFQVAWMPRILQTINISVRCVSIPTSTGGHSKHLELLANAAASSVSQAMAMPVAILGKGIRGNLCQKYVLVTRISGGLWGAAFLGKPKNFQETLGPLWSRIRGKSMTNKHRISDRANRVSERCKQQSSKIPVFPVVAMHTLTH